MSVLIKDMEMPEHCGYCRFRYDGICHALQKTQYATTDCPLVSVPVQPEIIRCKDCGKREVCRTSTVWAVAPGDDWFCADAERRTDG